MTKRTHRINRIRRLCEQQDHKCYYCGYPIAHQHDLTSDDDISIPPVGWDFATFDHITPKSKNGAGTINNGVAACASCNVWRGDVSFQEWCKRSTHPLYKTRAHKKRLQRIRKLYNKQGMTLPYVKKGKIGLVVNG
jgi:hypothetical protein